MRQVFDEVLRQLPLGTTAARVNSEDCTLGGHHIPAGVSSGDTHGNTAVQNTPVSLAC